MSDPKLWPPRVQQKQHPSHLSALPNIFMITSWRKNWVVLKTEPRFHDGVGPIHVVILSWILQMNPFISLPKMWQTVAHFHQVYWVRIAGLVFVVPISESVQQTQAPPSARPLVTVRQPKGGQRDREKDDRALEQFEKCSPVRSHHRVYSPHGPRARPRAWLEMFYDSSLGFVWVTPPSPC